MKFHSTPRRMLFIFDRLTHQYKPVGSGEIPKLPQESILYEVSYTYSGNEKEQLHLSLGYFYKVSDNDILNPKYTRFLSCSGNATKYIFSSRQVYSNQIWSELPYEQIVSLSDQYGDRGQFCIGFYGSIQAPLSEACPQQPKPDSNALNDLLACIDKTRKDIEIQSFFGMDPFHDYRVRDPKSVVIDNARAKTNSPALRTRMLEIVELKNDNNPAYNEYLNNLADDLEKSNRFANQEQFKLIRMQVLSGFIAAIGIAAVAVAFAVLANPVGVGIVAGIGVTVILAAGYLFFKNYSAEPATFDSYCEQATLCK